MLYTVVYSSVGNLTGFLAVKNLKFSWDLMKLLSQECGMYFLDTV